MHAIEPANYKVEKWDWRNCTSKKLLRRRVSWSWLAPPLVQLVINIVARNSPCDKA
jgi:hypothetical protein